MILRRLADAITEQNWFTVVLEVLIVVVGIFLGLQVDDWNGARKDRALEQEYLERLHADMAGSITDQLANDDWDEERIDTQNIVLKALRSGQLGEEERPAFERGLLHLGSMNPLRLRWATVEELRSTGNLAILQDLQLRELIGQTEANFKRNNELLAGSVQAILLHRIEIKKKFEVSRYDFSHGADVEILYDFDALAADPEFRNTVSHMAFNTRFIRMVQGAHIQNIEALRDKLATVLGLPPVEAEETP